MVLYIFVHIEPITIVIVIIFIYLNIYINSMKYLKYKNAYTWLYIVHYI